MPSRTTLRRKRPVAIPTSRKMLTTPTGDIMFDRRILLFYPTQIAWARMQELHRRSLGQKEGFNLVHPDHLSPVQAKVNFRIALECALAQFAVVQTPMRQSLFASLLKFVTQVGSFDGLESVFLTGLNAMAIAGQTSLFKNGLTLWQEIDPPPVVGGGFHSIFFDTNTSIMTFLDSEALASLGSNGLNSTAVIPTATLSIGASIGLLGHVGDAEDGGSCRDYFGAAGGIVGANLGAIAGGATGAIGGMAAGTAVPLIGTLAGGIVGGVAGWITGGLAGWGPGEAAGNRLGGIVCEWFSSGGSGPSGPSGPGNDTQPGDDTGPGPDDQPDPPPPDPDSYPDPDGPGQMVASQRGIVLLSTKTYITGPGVTSLFSQTGTGLMIHSVPQLSADGIAISQLGILAIDKTLGRRTSTQQGADSVVSTLNVANSAQQFSVTQAEALRFVGEGVARALTSSGVSAAQTRSIG